MGADGHPDASVIVAVNPHEHDFSVVLNRLAMQVGAGRYEVVVAHDGKRRQLDAEWETHRSRHPASPVRCIQVAATGRGALNNAGVHASSGSLLIFSADDAQVPAGFVAAHRAFHDGLERPGVGIGPIWFPQALRDDAFRCWVEDSGENYGFAMSQGAVAWQPGFFFVGNASMRRETFDRIGGFDERFPFDMHEDHVFGQALLAAGYRFTQLPRAYSLHDHRVDFDERKDAMRRLGATSLLLDGRYANLARTQARSPAEIEALRRRVRSADAAAAAAPSFAANRRRWLAGLDLAYAEGAAEARAGTAVRPPPSEG